MATILGLDLGTNSIGWAVIDDRIKQIVSTGSRIIPMESGRLGDFEKGNSVSFTAKRTQSRGMRRLHERFLLRRERLIRVIRIMGFLPEHFSSQLSRHGKLPEDKELKLAWREGPDGKMEFLFKAAFEEMVADFHRAGVDTKIPYDWTIYYLRQKALTQPISQQELAWILLQFNQKRGYHQLRGKADEGLDDSKEKNEEKSYHELKVIKVEDTHEPRKGGGSWYNITLENGWVYKRPSLVKPDWEGKTQSFIATFQLDKDGKRKSDQPKLRSPQGDDWGLRKIKTEQDIEQSGLTIGAYIYQSLLHNPDQKIIDGHVQTVDRKLYLSELRSILDQQKKYIPELNDHELYLRCLEELYPNNEAYRNSIANRDFTYLLAEDILFYQRPLKSKRSLIDNCPFETRHDKPIKCIAKSHPLFQEFRIWQFISNLHIFESYNDVTPIFLPDHEAYTNLFDFLSSIKSIDQKGLFRYLKIPKNDAPKYHWNYVQDKAYPVGETRAILLEGLRKANIPKTFLTPEKEEHLWHILYSVDDPTQYRTALRTFAKHQGWDDSQTDSFAQAFDSLTVYKEKEYGAYSAKAISRLLPLMRRGKYWNLSAIDKDTLSRIEHIITGESDPTLTPFVRDKFSYLHDIAQCQGLGTWQACYLVYNRHSEAIDTAKWNKPEDIDIFLDQFRHNSLNNPVVEQVVTECLRVVRDIWQQIGHPDEIHIELGRELKKTKAERERLTKIITEGENTNQRIRLLLLELLNPDFQVDDVRPQSPSQQEKLKIYEEGVFQSGIEIPDDIQDIQKRFTSPKNKPTHAEVIRYKLWLDQKYISPYTGKPIPLSKLFTTAYQIEHIIPQSRWFDDSYSNKVICESEVNQLKDRELGHEFIVHHAGEEVSLNLGGTVKIFTADQYEEHIKTTFTSNPKKMRNLMLDEIPEDFTSRQMNDSRHISRLMMQLLSNIVRTEDEEGNLENAATSKNVIACNGAVTDRLKHDWGLDDVWNRIILPRFERLNKITDTTDYTDTTPNGHTIPSVPVNLRPDFNKKRIDHRHHAMDAIVIACTTRNHVNLLSNEAANNSKRYDLQHTLRQTEYYQDPQGNKHERFTLFYKPWPSFTQDAYQALQSIVVSFKQNLRVINKTSNRYTIIQNGKHITVKQTKGDSWAIRKPLHKDTVFGEVNLQLKKKVRIKEALKDPNSIVNRELKAKIKKQKALHYTDKQIIEYLNKHKDIWSEAADGKIEVYYYTKDTPNRYFATRKDLFELFEKVSTLPDALKVIDSITDSGIRSILYAHLQAESNNPSEAFSADGIERMNSNIQTLNNGHPHLPIKKVRKYEQANKYSIGDKGQKKTKFVEAAKDTNLFFVIYTDAKGTRGYVTVSLNLIIELQKQYEKDWKNHLAGRLKADDLQMLPPSAHILHVFSPGDLVYVPTEEERQNGVHNINVQRIFKMVSCTGKQCHFLPYTVATVVLPKTEYQAMDKMERALTGEMIKEVCIPIQIDRLGNITKIG